MMPGDSGTSMLKSTFRNPQLLRILVHENCPLQLRDNLSCVLNFALAHAVPPLFATWFGLSVEGGPTLSASAVLLNGEIVPVDLRHGEFPACRLRLEVLTCRSGGRVEAHAKYGEPKATPPNPLLLAQISVIA